VGLAIAWQIVPLFLFRAKAHEAEHYLSGEQCANGAR